MKSTEMTMVAVLVGAGCAALIAGLRLVLRRASQRQQATNQQITALTATVKALEACVAELSRRTPPAGEIEPISAAAECTGLAPFTELEPKTLAVITAAATAFLGKAAHIRSARPLPVATGNVSPWSQQGRVIVQTSHNLRGRD